MGFAEFQQAFNGVSSVLVLTHDYPDPDALAAGWGMSQLFEKICGAKTALAFGGFIGRAENRAMVRLLSIDAVPLSWVDIASFDKIFMVDSQPWLGNASIPQVDKVHGVIDHHPLAPTTKDVPYVDVRSDYGACSTIVSEYIFDSGMKIDNNLATALYFGIKSDTLEFYREATPKDRDSYLRLFPMVALHLLSRIERPHLPSVHYRCIAQTLKNALVFDNLIISHVGELETPETVAEMADFLVRQETCHWVLCTGSFKGNLFLSLRNTVANGDCGMVMQQLVSDLGTGGGHGMMAGGKIPLEVFDYKSMSLKLAQRFLHILQCENKEGIPLV
jgi:nanoRNase/pAp phosphatase (c-di-AMP/oligoRNAs hydrolase)